MPEQKMSYQERLDKTCDQLAYEKGTALKYSDVKQRELYEKDAIHRIAAQAEAIRVALFDLLYVPFGGSRQEFETHTNKWLLEHGYIEPKNEEDGK